ncbi:hypothetical protein BGX24_008644 [Mortierella sp. AD032]|nr:hypothetical protein BGX24_008644 [Mortierella sp. AD032]
MKLSLPLFLIATLAASTEALKLTYTVTSAGSIEITAFMAYMTVDGKSPFQYCIDVLGDVSSAKEDVGSSNCWYHENFKGPECKTLWKNNNSGSS